MGKSHLYVGFVCCTLGLVIGSLLDGNFNRVPAPAPQEVLHVRAGDRAVVFQAGCPVAEYSAPVQGSDADVRFFRLPDDDSVRRVFAEAVRAAGAEMLKD